MSCDWGLMKTKGAPESSGEQLQDAAELAVGVTHADAGGVSIGDVGGVALTRSRFRVRLPLPQRGRGLG